MNQPIQEAGAALPRVMVVEDEPLLCMAVADPLELAGFHVVEASSGDEAVILLSSNSPKVDLVFTGVRMPGSVDDSHLAIG